MTTREAAKNFAGSTSSPMYDGSPSEGLGAQTIDRRAVLCRCRGPHRPRGQPRAGIRPPPGSGRVRRPKAKRHRQRGEGQRPARPGARRLRRALDRRRPATAGWRWSCSSTARAPLISDKPLIALCQADPQLVGARGRVGRTQRRQRLGTAAQLAGASSPDRHLPGQHASATPGRCGAGGVPAARRSAAAGPARARHRRQRRGQEARHRPQGRTGHRPAHHRHPRRELQGRHQGRQDEPGADHLAGLQRRCRSPASCCTPSAAPRWPTCSSSSAWPSCCSSCSPPASASPAWWAAAFFVLGCYGLAVLPARGWAVGLLVFSPCSPTPSTSRPACRGCGPASPPFCFIVGSLAPLRRRVAVVDHPAGRVSRGMSLAMFAGHAGHGAHPLLHAHDRPGVDDRRGGRSRGRRRPRRRGPGPGCPVAGPHQPGHADHRRAPIRVVGIEGLLLEVEPEEGGAEDTGNGPEQAEWSARRAREIMQAARES